MRSTLAVAVTAIAIGLFSTTTEAQTQAQVIAQSFLQCTQGVFNSPEASLLLVHVSFNGREPSAAQLSDNAVPTPREAMAVRALYPRIRNCQQQAAAQVGIYVPTVSSLVLQSYRETDADVELLAARQMSWGTFTQRRRDRAVAYQTQAQNEINRLRQVAAYQAAQVQQQYAAQQSAQAAAEQQRRQLCFAAALLQGSAPQVGVPVTFGSAMGYAMSRCY